MCTKKLVFTKGDETRPKIENLNNPEVLNASIFSDIYNRAFDLIYGIATQQIVEHNDQNRERNNIVAFIGERGSGKTSCLKSVYKALSKHEFSSEAKDKIIFNTSLPPIDPSYLDEQSNILEIVIAHLFKIFKQQVSRNVQTLGEDKLEKKRQLVKRFQEVKDALDCLNSNRKENKYHNDSIEELSKLAAGSNLRVKMEKLVDCFLKYNSEGDDASKRILVISIDDLDVQTNHTYKMVEQIRKYLIIDKVVILMGVKLVQLSDLIKKKFSEDFNSDAEKDAQIDDMVARYLMKLLPLSHRLILPSYSEIPDIELILQDETEYDKKLSIRDRVLKLIYNKTRMMFYNIYAQDSLIVPYNLREFLNLLSLLDDLPSLHTIPDDSREKQKKFNRKIFRQYFVESWSLDKLTPKQTVFIEELTNCDATLINKYIIDYFYREYEAYLEEKKFRFDRTILYIQNKSYNVSIGDVLYVLSLISNINDIATKRLIFAVKTVYSMLLHDKFNEMITYDSLKDHSELLYNYQNHTRSYKAINKLNHIFDYEAMIGDVILNIDYDRRPEYAPLYMTVTTTSILHEIYDSILFKYKNGINIDDDKDKFNLFEFFVLSTSYYALPYHARSSRMSHHNAFPLAKYPDDSVITINFISIIPNITKFYNLYRKYVYLDLTHQEVSSNDDFNNFKDFFNLIYYFKKDSLIYKLISTDEIVNPKEKDHFKDKVVERTAIYNIEHLEILEDYIGNIHKSRLTPNNNSEEVVINEYMDNKNFENIHSMLDKLSRFCYYKYGNDREQYEDVVYTHLKEIPEFLTRVKNNPELKTLFMSIYNNRQWKTSAEQ